MNAPEPSQLTGPGSSFAPRLHRTPSQLHSDNSKSSGTNLPASPTRKRHHHHSSSTARHANSPNSSKPSRSIPQEKLDEQKLVELLGFDPSCPSRDIRSRPTSTPVIKQPAPPSPRRRPSKSSSAESLRAPRDPTFRANVLRDRKYPPISGNRTFPALHRSQSLNSEQPALGRENSLLGKYSGDMSRRPLDQIKRDTKTANRSPHLRKKNIAGPDIIDALDDVGIGGTYHHGGPFDATLASRNRDKRYAPVEAVKDSNLEALKATPREYVQDSLRKHVPLQGTASIPSGQRDMFGRRMSYEEGADIMRDADAPGGAYRRYDHVPYHPEDLKGKGEPSYTIERDAKDQKRARKQIGSTESGAVYEMQPTKPTTKHSPGHKDRGVTVRQRSTSSSGPSGSKSPNGESRDVDVRRSSSTTGKRLSDGIKRRISGIRRKYHNANDA